MRLYLLLSIFAILAIIALEVGQAFITQKQTFPAPSDTVQNPIEQAVAFFDDGTDAFYEQVKQSDGAWIENTGNPIFDNTVASTPPPRLAVNADSAVLGSDVTQDGREKWIEVDISDQKLYALEGDKQVYAFAISSGRSGYDTVQGEFRVWRKVRMQAYKGGSKQRGDYYYLPNVPYSLFFHKGYAIHGTYWHNDFGIRRRSHGCVNMRIADAEKIYHWAGPAMSAGVNALNSSDKNPGIRVVVHE